MVLGEVCGINLDDEFGNLGFAQKRHQRVDHLIFVAFHADLDGDAAAIEQAQEGASYPAFAGMARGVHIVGKLRWSRLLERVFYAQVTGTKPLQVQRASLLSASA